MVLLSLEAIVSVVVALASCFLLSLIQRLCGSRTSKPRCTGNVRLIIDGSNGPLRLDPTRLSSDISFLRVENGINCSDRMDLVPALQRFLAAHAKIFGRVEVFFDGRGVFPKKETMPADYDPSQGKNVRICSDIQLKITPWWTEADGLIVQQVAASSRTEPSCHEQSFESTVKDALDCDRNDARNHDESQLLVYTLVRDAAGPGKARRVLKRYDLLRPESVFCIFNGLSQPADNQHVLTQLAQSKVSWAQIRRRALSQNTPATIVATDDILLRQRIVASGGYVLTFEQLWLSLLPYANVSAQGS